MSWHILDIDHGERTTQFEVQTYDDGESLVIVRVEIDDVDVTDFVSTKLHGLIGSMVDC